MLKNFFPDSISMKTSLYTCSRLRQKALGNSSLPHSVTAVSPTDDRDSGARVRGRSATPLRLRHPRCAGGGSCWC